MQEDSDTLTETSTTATIEAEKEETTRTSTEDTISLEELSRLARESYQTSETQSTADYLSNSLGVSIDSGQSLEGRIQTFQKSQTRSLTNYLNRVGKKPALNDNFFSILHGFDPSINTYRDQQEILPSFLLPNTQRKTGGGYFFKWNGTGVVINPGPGFLTNFHRQGHHIRDIHAVIVTTSHSEQYTDLKNIYDINYRLNAASDKLHTINYYLNQQAYRNLATLLKPNFKQERDTVHCLELYVDSPDMETMELASGISLRYFPTTSRMGSSDNTTGVNPIQMGNLGLRFDLTGNTSYSPDETTTIGYVSNTSWTTHIADQLRGANCIIAGFGNTSTDDFSKIKYQNDSIGYFGMTSVIEEIAPKMVIATEFGGREGDIRLEAIKKLRQEASYSSHNETTALPGDYGLLVDLSTQRVLCSISNTLVEPAQVRVTKSQDNFGRLSYLSSNCFI